MCGFGVTACQHLLGARNGRLPGASLYAGSWSEWIRDQAPVATGTTPERVRAKVLRRRSFTCSVNLLSCAANEHACRVLNRKSPWKIEQSLDLYQVEAWARVIFRSMIRVMSWSVRTWTRRVKSICMMWWTGLKARDLHAPVVIRFSDIPRIACVTWPKRSPRRSPKMNTQPLRGRVPDQVNQQRLSSRKSTGTQEFGFVLSGIEAELLAVMSITKMHRTGSSSAMDSGRQLYRASSWRPSSAARLFRWSRISRKYT